MTAELVFHNARIWTADPESPWAEALAIKGTTLLAVGRTQDMPQAERRIDLKGRLVLPGLWDAHIHFYYWSLGLHEVKLAGCSSLEQMLARVADKGHEPGDWLTGWGWNETLWEDSTEPTRWDLDRVTDSQTPAIFWRSDMHSAVANSCALEMAGLLREPAEVTGGVVETNTEGQLTGILRELAINFVRQLIPAPTASQVDEAMLDGMAELHRCGITGICEQRMKDHDDGPKALGAFGRLNQAERLKLRVNCNLAAHALDHIEGLGLSYGLGDDRLRLGHLKIFTDGTLGSRTAWMLEPMLGGEDCGVVLTPPEQIGQEIRRAVTLGFPVSIHAIGDRANRSCLELFEAAPPQTQPVPHRIEHVQLLQPEDAPRLAGLCASVQPAHLLDDMDTADEFLGPRASLAYRFADLHKAGALLAFGSDAPVADHNPFYGIHGAVFRQRPDRMQQPAWYPGQRLSLEQTLKAYTLGAAQAAGWDTVTGSLVAGKRADLCVLDRDLFRLVEGGVKGDELCATQVELTIFDGEIVHQADSFALSP